MSNPPWLDEGILSRQITQGNDIAKLTEKIDHLVEVVDKRFAHQESALLLQHKALEEIKESVRKYKWLNRIAGSVVGVALVGTGSLAPDQIGNFVRTFRGLL